MSGCRIVGMGCYGKFATFYRIFVKLTRHNARVSGGNLELEDEMRVPKRVISPFSGEPFVPDLPAEKNIGKLNIAGFKSRLPDFKWRTGRSRLYFSKLPLN